MLIRWDGSLADTRRFYCEDPWGNRIKLIAVAQKKSAKPTPRE